MQCWTFEPGHTGADFGVSWNSALDRGGVIVGDDVAVTIDIEATL